MRDRLHLDDESLWPHPADVADAAWEMRYRRDPDFQVATMLDCLHHLMTHPAGTERMVAQLRSVRRAVRDIEGGCDDE